MQTVTGSHGACSVGIKVSDAYGVSSVATFLKWIGQFTNPNQFLINKFANAHFR
jgi:hypothetical protein